nr:lipopolysaccharide biosynthesis protein [Muribaculaceae bacterium]
INTFYTGKLINLGFFKQMSDIFPTLILSGLMGLIVYFTGKFLCTDTYLQIIVGVIIGTSFYITCAKIFRFSEFKEILILVTKKS